MQCIDKFILSNQIFVIILVVYDNKFSSKNQIFNILKFFVNRRLATFKVEFNYQVKKS
jgi:hypothetical protein